MRMFISFIMVLGMLTTAATAFAGNLDSPGAPAAGSGMPTLTDIYNQLDTGAVSTPAPSFQEPLSGPTAGSGKSLSDLKSKLPAPDNTNGAATADVLSGKTFWGLRTDGTWGLNTGTLSFGSNVTGGNGLLTFSIPDGYYSGKTATANDANLVSSNIKSGVSIFGVSGTMSAYTCTTGDLSPLGRWCDNGNGTVRDMTTGLIWLQDAGWGGQYPFWVNTMVGTNAHDRAAQVKNGTPTSLTDGSIEGDWRLPTKSELVGLTTGTEAVSSSNMYKFSNVQSWYWSSTTYTYNTYNAWLVRMSNGNVIFDVKGVNDYVWPVRSGTP